MLPRISNRVFLALSKRDALELDGAFGDPRSAQLKVLRRILAANRASQFGRAHGFGTIADYAEFVRRVPINDYDDLHCDVERIRAGAAGVRTAEDVDFLEPTGGSSGATKLIPYTKSLKREIARATNSWIRDLYLHRPDLRAGRAYWAVSPPDAVATDRTSALPIGAPHDLDYLPSPVAALLERTLVLPRATSEVGKLEAARYVTLRALLGAEDLTFISVWNPSFLTLLMKELDERFEMLLHDLERGTISVEIEASLHARLSRCLPARPDLAARLRRRFRAGAPDDLSELWTRLQTISCWTDGHAARAVTGMRDRFPHVEVQGKGLIATEGIVSFPLSRLPAPVAAVTSHFLEFVPEGGGEARLVDELEAGRTYEVLLTTGGGLYRYRLKDLVQVCGHAGVTPMLRFEGRADATSDLCGEKLTPAFVERALASAMESSGVRAPFALLAPRWGEPPSYDLWIEPPARHAEAAASILAAALETELRRAHHYDLCRKLGQLGPVHTRLVHEAQRAYERACVGRGQRAGAVKPPVLIADLSWSDSFEEAMA